MLGLGGLGHRGFGIEDLGFRILNLWVWFSDFGVFFGLRGLGFRALESEVKDKMEASWVRLGGALFL